MYESFFEDNYNPFSISLRDNFLTNSVSSYFSHSKDENDNNNSSSQKLYSNNTTEKNILANASTNINTNTSLITNEYSNTNLNANKSEMCTFENTNINTNVNTNLDTNSNTNTNLNTNTNTNLNTNTNANNSNKNFRPKKKNGKPVRYDNIIYEFKTRFYQKYLIEICNKLIEKYSPLETRRFKKIDNNVISNVNIIPNLKLLDSSLKEFLSFNISVKYKKFDKENNKNLLKDYLNYNDYFKKLFNTKISDLYQIFKDENCVNKNKELFTIESNLSLKYFLDKIDENKCNYKNEIELYWKNIYKYFLEKNKKNQNENFFVRKKNKKKK